MFKDLTLLGQISGPGSVQMVLCTIISDLHIDKLPRNQHGLHDQIVEFITINEIGEDLILSFSVSSIHLALFPRKQHEPEYINSQPSKFQDSIPCTIPLSIQRNGTPSRLGHSAKPSVSKAAAQSVPPSSPSRDNDRREIQRRHRRVFIRDPLRPSLRPDRHQSSGMVVRTEARFDDDAVARQAKGHMADLVAVAVDKRAGAARTEGIGCGCPIGIRDFSPQTIAVKIRNQCCLSDSFLLDLLDGFVPTGPAHPALPKQGAADAARVAVGVPSGLVQLTLGAQGMSTSKPDRLRLDSAPMISHVDDA